MDNIATLCNEVSLVCGHLAVDMNLMPLAVQLADKVLVKSPGNKGALLLLARIHLLKKEYESVLELLGDCGKDTKLWAIFSLACYRLGLCDRAVEAMEQCHEKEVDETELHLNLNILQCRILLLADLRNNSLPATVPQFERTLELTQHFNVPTLHLEVLLTRAQLFEKNGDLEKCFFDLQDSISILQNPEAMTHFQIKDFLYKTTFTYLYKIFLQVRTKVTTEPVDQLFQECFQFPHSTETIHMITVARSIYSVTVGEAFDLEGFVTEISNASSTLKPFALYIAARILVEFGVKETFHKALEYYQLSLKLNPSKAYVWISMASLHLNLGHYPDALFAFSRAIGIVVTKNDHRYPISRHTFLDSRSELGALAWYGTAQAYLSTDDIEKALSAIGKAIESLDHVDLLEKKKLIEFNDVLQSRDYRAIERLKKDMSLPELRLQFFLSPLFYLEENQVFQVECRLERSSFIVPRIMSPVRTSHISVKSSGQQDVSKKVKKKPIKKAPEGTKTTKFRNKRKNDIFRRANLSISKSDKNHSSQHKKKAPQIFDETHKSSAGTHISNLREQDFTADPNASRVIIPNGHNNTTPNIDDNQINNALIAHTVTHNPNIAPNQQQHLGYLYQGDEQIQSNQIHQHHEAGPFGYPAFISSHTTGIYPASYSHPIQPISFAASPSFYYPQQSIEEAFRNNSNGLGEQGLPPTFGPPVIMPQFSNPVYISDGARYAANSLQPAVIPMLSAQQPQPPQYAPVTAKHADVGVSYTER